MVHKTIIGLTENVRIQGKMLKARIDTGAHTSSIDGRMAKKLDLGPPIKSATIRSASGNSVRPVIRVRVGLKGREIIANFTVADRGRMNYPVLLGRNILKQGFLIDAEK